VRARRIKYGGNRKINYTEGWVEFKDKREAKLVAAALNNTTIGACRPRYKTRQSQPLTMGAGATVRGPAYGQVARSATFTTTTSGRSSTCPSSSGTT